MAAKARQGSWHAYDVVVERNVMVTARDGIRLATDIYLPALAGSPAAGKFPAIVERTPYARIRRASSAMRASSRSSATLW